MEVPAALLAIGAVVAGGLVVVVWSALRSSAARDAAALAPVGIPPAQAPALPASFGALAERVEALERQVPEYRIAMEQIADRCDEVLEAADRKRRRAQSIANREETPTEAPEPQTRADQIRLVRQRYGQ